MRILGHEFREMTNEDYLGFAGADEGDLICELEDLVLIWSVRNSELIAVDESGTEITWKVVQ